MNYNLRVMFTIDELYLKKLFRARHYISIDVRYAFLRTKTVLVKSS